MTSPLRPARDGVLLAVRVTPKSSRDQVMGLHAAADGTVSLAIKVTAAPDKGKANKAVIALLAEALARPKSAFKLVAGGTDRHKTILVAGNLPELEALIAPYRNSIQTDR